MPKSNSKIRALDDKSFDILCNKPVKKVLKTSRLKKKKKSGVEGQKSFGKATMDKTFKLANNMRVRFIVGAMYTATGQSWHSRGLAPTVEVAGKQEDFERWSRLPDNRRMQADRQLRSAWQMLRKR